MNKKAIVIIILMLSALIAASGYFGIAYYRRDFRKSDWYAVHLINNQTYFGRIARITSDVIKMENVYYFEEFEPEILEASTTSASENFKLRSAPQKIYNLVKQGEGDNFTLTDNNVSFNRNSVLFWEKLDFNSEVFKLIEKNEK